jgi:hypothetical protein
MSVEKNAKAFAEERVNFLIDNNYIDKNRREEVFESLRYKFIEEDARDKEYIAKYNNRRTQES